jgi:hypothetical protein
MKKLQIYFLILGIFFIIFVFAMAICQEYMKDLDNLPTIVGICFLFLFAFLILYLETRDAFRKKEIKEYCEKNGLEYLDSVDSLPEIADFNILHKGYEGKNEYHAIMRGQREDVYFTLLDYSYVASCGNNDGVFNVSLCILSKADMQFPDMILDEKVPFLAGTLDQALMAQSGKNIVKTIGDSTFENKFSLVSTDAKAVKEYFKSGVIEAFLKNYIKGCRYDACDDTITIAHLNFLHYGLKKRLEMLKKGVELITEIDRARKAVLN